jgi:hypothetical protein
MEKKLDLQNKMLGIYKRIKEDFYLCRDDLDVNGAKFNSALLFGILTELNKGNLLLFGEYGGGKTTSAEYLNSIINALPLDLVKRVAIRGNPQLTEEKMIGRPNYGKMHQGIEDVVWQHFTLIGQKVFDEFNRIPESNQTLVLNGVDRGEWNYLNHCIVDKKEPFFATANYPDGGNNPIIPPLLDRIDAAVEVRFPGAANYWSYSDDFDNSRDGILKNKELTLRSIEVLNSGKPYPEIENGLQEIVDQHSKKLIANGFDIPTRSDLENIREEIKAVGWTTEADMYKHMLASELFTHPKYREKRSNDPIDNSHGEYLNSRFTVCGRRFGQSLVKHAKSLAWFQGHDKVNLDHVSIVVPYVLWHRIKWTNDTLQAFARDEREDPLDLHISKTLFGEGTAAIPGVKKRFIESKENYQKVIDLTGNGNIDEAIEEAEDFYEDGKGHPVFKEIIRDLQEN